MPHEIADAGSPRQTLIAADPSFAARWHELRARVCDFEDKLHRGMDGGIVDTVTAFLMLGFGTMGSCEGHVDRASAGPWVQLMLPEPVTPPYEDHDETVRLFVELRAPITELLDGFYGDRSRGQYQLVADNLWHSRLDAIIGLTVRSALLTEVSRGKAAREAFDLQAARAEMSSFTDFMIGRAVKHHGDEQPTHPVRLKSVDTDALVGEHKKR